MTISRDESLNYSVVMIAHCSCNHYCLLQGLEKTDT